MVKHRRLLALAFPVCTSW